MSVQLSQTISRFDAGKLRGCLPVDAVIRDGRPGLLWLEMQGADFREPFFEQTVERIRRERPYLSEHFTEFDELLKLEASFSNVEPAGFIFHSSRCGSTAVSNALKSLSNARVISEPSAVEKLIGRYFTDVNDDRRKEVLYSVLVRSAVKALGQSPAATENRYFVKFSSVSVLQLARLKRIWPKVPWVFVYRHPVEVMVSNLEDPPHWMDVSANRPTAAAMIGVSEDEIRELSREEFCARALAGFYSTALSMIDNDSLLLNYEELSLESLTLVAGFFGLDPTTEEKEAIRTGLGFYAKDPQGTRPFVADSERKRSTAPRPVWESAERWALTPYRELQEERTRLRISKKENY